MAAIFRPFSFDAASRHDADADADDAAMDVSPTASTPVAPPPPAAQTDRLPTPPPCPMRRLAQKLDAQNLHIEVDPRYHASRHPPTPPSDDDSFATQQLDRPPQPDRSRVSTSVLRMQRQANTRMQCSASHIKDISVLVRQMVEDEDQCVVCEPPQHRPADPPAQVEDEGVDMDYTPSPDEALWNNLNFRRAGERLGPGSMVAKPIRMRKKSGITKRTSK